MDGQSWRKKNTVVSDLGTYYSVAKTRDLLHFQLHHKVTSEDDSLRLLKCCEVTNNSLTFLDYLSQKWPK